MSGLSNEGKSKLQRLGLSLTRIQRDVEEAKEQLSALESSLDPRVTNWKCDGCATIETAMTFLNLVRDAHPAPIEWLVTRLSAVFPECAFCLSVNVDEPTMLTLRLWESNRLSEIYSFPRSLLVHDRPREVEMAVAQYITFLRAHRGCIPT